MAIFDYTVVGGGIVGLATAYELGKAHPGARLLILEKEAEPALHQTGRNSGVIHSGIYYQPGSYKARFAKAGADSMVAFCRDNGVPHEVCGKLIVATEEEELPLLENLYGRGQQNGVPVKRLAREKAREIEPHVNCRAALRVESTGITDYRRVGEVLLEKVIADGGEIRYGSRVIGIRRQGSNQLIETETETIETRFVVNCAGLYSDRLARLAGAESGARIVPFRGEYFQLVPERRDLVKTLIYPVPNPQFPFLGVHFTKMVDGSVHAGPNAVLALGREAYRKSDFNLRDLSETLTYAGFWRLLAGNLGEGLKEIHRSLSKAAFTRSLQRLIPDIRSEDLVPCDAGVRAQALRTDGTLVDDFLLVPSDGALHVCNAPSPAATASLEIGKEIARQVPDVVPVSVGGSA